MFFEGYEMPLAMKQAREPTVESLRASNVPSSETCSLSGTFAAGRFRV